MFWKKKVNLQETEKSLSLAIHDTTGAPAFTYPGEVIDSLRYMLTRVSKSGLFPASLSMVSSLRGEGVSYLAMALGATVAHDLGIKTCVVELNWWWPSANLLVASKTTGLASVISGDAALEDVIIPTDFNNLSFVPAGFMSREERPVTARSKKLKTVLEELSQNYDTLILDIPAIRATNDAIPLAALGAACCLVIRQRVTSKLDVQLALDEISHLKVLGVVMNQFKLATPTRLVKMLSAV